MLSPIDKLRQTDITEFSLEALTQSKIKKVSLVGRRGPLQAAFTIAELREMLKLTGVDTVWKSTDFKGVAEQIDSLPRPRKRLTELMVKHINEPRKKDCKIFNPIFFRSPIKINGNDRVDSVDFSVNQLLNDKAVMTDDVENINAQLVCKSIGYKSISVDNSLNFDAKQGRVINKCGRVLKHNSDEIDNGLYVAGWLGTGPSGVILTTMNNAFSVAQTVIDDIKSETIKCDFNKPGIDVKHYQTVTWKDWLKIDKKEIENGKKMNKPREKIVTIEEMMNVL